MGHISFGARPFNHATTRGGSSLEGGVGGSFSIGPCISDQERSKSIWRDIFPRLRCFSFKLGPLQRGNSEERNEFSQFFRRKLEFERNDASRDRDVNVERKASLNGLAEASLDSGGANNRGIEDFMDRKSFLWMRPLIIQPDPTIHGGRLDKLITFSSINNDNRDPITRMHDPFVPAPSHTFIFRESFRALYTALSDTRFITSPLIDPPIFFLRMFRMNSPFLFLFSFILSRLISRFVYRRLDRHESKDSAFFSISKEFFSFTLREKCWK